MPRVGVELGQNSYDILIGRDILMDFGKVLTEVFDGDTILVITNPVVAGYYGNEVVQSLEMAGFDVSTIEVPDGERSKSPDTAANLYDRMLDIGLDRSSLVVALGGGVTGDLAGFVAATYMRGISYVQVPTTLVAQVDSSVGGKVAVDHPKGKNLIGAFYQPKLVYVDTKVLDTLDARQVRAGLAEVVKHGVIWDENFFSYLEQNLNSILELDPTVMEGIIEGNCKIKAHVVSTDEKEQGLRSVLNYGHTIGHALETATGYEGLLHGEAVAMGMTAAARIATKMDLVEDSLEERQAKLLEGVGLPTRLLAVNVSEILETMTHDKKVKSGRVRFVLPLRVGRVVLRDDVPERLLRQVLAELRAEPGQVTLGTSVKTTKEQGPIASGQDQQAATSNPSPETLAGAAPPSSLEDADMGDDDPFLQAFFSKDMMPSAEAHFDLGMTSQLKGALHKAIKNYEKVIEQRPDFFAARHQLGKCYLKLGEFSKAADLFEEVTERMPDRVEPLINLGMAYFHLGQLDKAEKKFQSALATSRRNVKAAACLGMVYFERKDWGKAISQLQPILEATPPNFLAHFLMGKIYLHLNDPARAGQQLDMAAQICTGLTEMDSRQPEVYYLLGEILRLKGEYGSALENYRVCEKCSTSGQGTYFAFGLYFTEVDLLIGMGLCHKNMNEATEARAIGRKILERDASSQAARELVAL